MQNRYTGDIGDFGKYGLLRFLFMPELRGLDLWLGVNWYLVPNESHNNDGRHIAYLQYTEPRKINNYKDCDASLYSQLQAIVSENRRSVNRVEERHILPQGTVFYGKKLTFENSPLQNRLPRRQAWVRKGFEALQNCDAAFFDPDNGIEVTTVSRTEKRGLKYVYYDELEPYFRRGQSLIIYNHRSMQPEEEYLERFRNLRHILKPEEEMFYLRFKRFSVRDFVFVLQPAHRKIRERAKKIIKTPWGRHFEYYDLD